MKKLTKIKMHEFIVNLMKESNRSDIFVSEIKDAIRNVAREADLMLYDYFDDTLESILEVVLIYPEHFVLDSDAQTLKLRNAEILSELADYWQISSNVKESIKEYLKKFEFPMMLAGIDLGQAEENEKYICKDTEYIDWLWDMLETNPYISTNQIEVATSGKDVANISRLFNLFIILSRYYNKNLMACYKGDTKEAYVFHYTKDGIKKYFVISQQIEGDDKVYKAVNCLRADDAPYFPDVALGVPCATLSKKYALIEKCKKLFEQTRDIDIRYEIIKDVLDKAYGKNYIDD